MYLSLISESSWQLHEDMLSYLEEHPGTKLAFQPGTFHFRWGKEKLKVVYARTNLLVVNREEAAEILESDQTDVHRLAQELHALGPDIVVITDGQNGSFAYIDEKLFSVPNFPDDGPPIDRTGAGDAFASTIVAALALGEPIEVALAWAPINSMNVVQHLGAQKGLLSKAGILQRLKKAPDTYVVTDITPH
jgi:ribokinase